MPGKKVLLINPWIYDFAAFDLWLKPIGLLYISSFLKQEGIPLSFIDCLDRQDSEMLSFLHLENSNDKKFGCGNYHKEEVNKPKILSDIPRNYYRYGIPVEVFKEKLSKVPSPDYVLVTSMMTYWYPGVMKAIEIVKEFFPKTTVILGGVYANLCSRHALEVCGADLVYCGRGLSKLINIIKGDYAPGEIERDDNIHSLDMLFPDYKKYSSLDYFCIMTSQGCPFKCTYCASNILYEGYLQREVDSVIDEIDYQVKTLECRNMTFYDDALLVNSKEHFEKIAEKLIKKNLNLNLHSPNGVHPVFINDSVAEKMKKAGFKTIRIGLETTNPQRQSGTGGKVVNRDFLNAMESLLKSGFNESEIGTYLFFGFPGQTIDEVTEGIKFVKSSGSAVNLVEYSPIPGTVMWNELEAKGIIQNNIDPLLHNNSVFFRKYSGISEDELQYLKRSVR